MKTWGEGRSTICGENPGIFTLKVDSIVVTIKESHTLEKISATQGSLQVYEEVNVVVKRKNEMVTITTLMNKAATIPMIVKGMVVEAMRCLAKAAVMDMVDKDPSTTRPQAHASLLQ